LTKIGDNIQIKIKTIHVRFEDAIFFKEPLSMGITLERLFIQTTDENWNPVFIDRTQTKN
jgi:hypothetical protein